MRQMTIRGFDSELELAIRETAESLDTSLNKAVLHLLRKGAGLLERPKRRRIGNRLDHLFGAWTDEDVEEFREATRGLDEVDPEMWR